MWETEVYIITFLVLALLAVEDIREKKIYTVIPVVASILLYAIRFHAGSAKPEEMAAGAAVGGMLIFVGFLCPGLLGTGDGVAFVMTGISSGFWGNLSLLWISSLLAGIYAVGLKLFAHKKGDYEFAFLPFVLGGYLICHWLLQ